jgi:thiol-disulfide isomerase/thioredoxin
VSLFKPRLLQPIILGLIAIPTAVLPSLQSSGVCESRDFGSGYFRAYANPKPVSKHAFTTNGGEKIDLNSLPGPRALLVNFWTTWCTPCKEEMPSMDRLQGRVSRDQLLILPLVRDGKGLSEAVRFYKVHDINNLPAAADRFDKISHDHRIGALPQTLFVDRQGLVKGLLTGGVDWESKPVLELLDNCLNVKVDQESSG